MCAPLARRMNSGSPPTPRKARTGELTPPAMYRLASSNRDMCGSSVIEAVTKSLDLGGPMPRDEVDERRQVESLVRLMSRGLHPRQWLVLDAEARADLREVMFEALEAPYEIDAEPACPILQHPPLRVALFAGLALQKGREIRHAADPRMTVIPAILEDVGIPGNQPVPGIADEGELEQRAEQLRRQHSLGACQLSL